MRPDPPHADPDPSRATELALLAIFALPILIGLGIRLPEGDLLLRDLDAVLCGAWRTAHGVSPYGEALACPEGGPARYMYLPQLARVLAPLARGETTAMLRLGFGLASCAAVGMIFHTLFLRPMDAAPRSWRAPILALTTGGALTCANLAFLCHALVLGVALTRRRGPGPLMVAIVLVSVLKPVFLTYLLIFAYESGPLWARARRIACGVVLAAVAAALILATGGEALSDWKAALDQVALGSEPGYGFLGWVDHLGLRASDPSTQLAFLVFAAAVSLAGLLIAEGRQLGGEARVFLALAVAQLVNPRLMTYDMIMLAPVAIALATTPPRLRPVFWWSGLGLGLAALVYFMRGDGGGLQLDVAALSLAVLAAGALAAPDAFRALAPAFRGLAFRPGREASPRP